MNIPALLFGIILSTLYGAAFHVWKGGGPRRILLYLGLAWAGFWVGHVLGSIGKLSFENVGALHVGAGTAGSLLFLFVGHWLSLVEVERK